MIYHIFYKYTFEKNNFYKAKFRTLNDILENVFFSKEYKETPHKHPICNSLRLYNYHFSITFLYFKETFKIPLKPL